jgi:hypothetical protein
MTMKKINCRIVTAEEIYDIVKKNHYNRDSTVT